MLRLSGSLAVIGIVLARASLPWQAAEGEKPPAEEPPHMRSAQRENMERDQ